MRLTSCPCEYLVSKNASFVLLQDVGCLVLSATKVNPPEEKVPDSLDGRGENTSVLCSS